MAKARPWIRLYTLVPDDPKIRRLSDPLHRLWIDCLCLAGRNDGILPGIDDVAFHHRKSGKSVAVMIGQLIDAGLLDQTEGGLEPHNFKVRQFEADVSTDRVKQFRERRKERRETVSETVSETEGNGYTKRFPSVCVSDSGFGSKKKNGDSVISADFDPFWARWCALTGRKQKESDARRAWIGSVEPDAAPLAMACLERYGASGDVARGAISNADKWIYEQARDSWVGDWPGPRNPPPGGSKQSRARSVLAELIQESERQEVDNGETDGSSSAEITWKALIADGAFSRRSRSAEGSGAYSHASRAGCGIGGESGRRAA